MARYLEDCFLLPSRTAFYSPSSTAIPSHFCFAGIAGMSRVRLTLPPPKIVDRWNEKRALFGVYDNIGILGET